MYETVCSVVFDDESSAYSRLNDRPMRDGPRVSFSEQSATEKQEEKR